MAQLLEDTNLDETQKDYLGMVRESADNMMSLVEQILELTALDANSVILSDTDYQLPGDAADFLAVIEQRCRQQGLDFNCHFADGLAASYRIDRRRLQQLLEILFSNALKFTSEGSVSLAVSQTVQANRPKLQFEVTDTGSGINEADIDKMIGVLAEFT